MHLISFHFQWAWLQWNSKNKWCQWKEVILLYLTNLVKTILWTNINDILEIDFIWKQLLTQNVCDTIYSYSDLHLHCHKITIYMTTEAQNCNQICTLRITSFEFQLLHSSAKYSNEEKNGRQLTRDGRGSL